jgi:hypothetical protein
MKTNYSLTFHELIFHVKNLNQVNRINPFWTSLFKFDFKDETEQKVIELLTVASPINESVNSFLRFCDWKFRPSGHTEALVTVNASTKLN